eukprot:TRINITY_DN520_c0_g1_i2.p1 TRINITY_DN520_c0_g1~~TRINITY_DN520_c0_g1_i2.p1  ORF type:complete len:312 (+),score=104.38 TRINITY_DN520_c0_g1_i2:280-1215(+)
MFDADDEHFKPMKKPKKGSWLAEHNENGQSFRQYSGGYRAGPTPRNNRIYLQPFGEFDEGSSPDLQALADHCEAFFGCEVHFLDPILVEDLPDSIATRINEDSGKLQLHASHLIHFLADMSKKLERVFITIGISMIDLYHRDSWNFVFGLASPDAGAGMFSFARYHPRFYDDDDGELNEDEKKLMLYRSLKVLAHEAGHLYYIKHCIHYKCLMNGSNHLEESDGKPIFLCPVCLRKLDFNSNLMHKPLPRYRKLLAFCEKYGFDNEAEWYASRIAYVEGGDDSSSSSSSSKKSSKSTTKKSKKSTTKTNSE